MFISSPRAPRLCLLFVCLLAIPISVFAQSQANTGNIEGRVTDPNAAAVPGVTVTATNVATGLSKTRVTNDEGIYRIVFMPPGTYGAKTTPEQSFAAASFSTIIAAA